ncbi:hypothetical protein JXR93_01500 [bacterium]|nr:hypothetical protein [bacterium]
MKKRDREVNIFNLSMLDVMTGALGAVMIVMIVLLTQKIGAEEDESPAKLSENAIELTKQANELYKEVESLKKDKENLSKEVKSLVEKAKNYTDRANTLLKDKELEQKESELKKREEELEKKEKEIKTAKNEEKTKLETEIEDLKSKIEILKKVIANLSKTDVADDKIGFEIPKKVVLVVDLSGSMINNPDKENRMDQVRAGLKMMIATMSKEHEVDIVFFPSFENLENTKECLALYETPESCKKYGDNKIEAYDNSDNCYKYGSFNKKLIKLADDAIKYDFYKKISCLKANFATPTMDTMKYVFETYKDAEGIILYSDGTPDNVKKKTMDTLVSEISTMNKDGKKIFTIGVGSEFRNEENTDAVNFLKKISQDNGGYYVGF